MHAGVSVAASAEKMQYGLQQRFPTHSALDGFLNVVSYTTEEMEWQMLITFWIRLCSVLNLMVMRIDSFYYVIAFYLINNVLTNIPFPHYLLIPGDDKPTLQFANPPRTVIIAITTLSM